MPTPRLILLDENDTVLVCVSPISSGDMLEIDGAVVAAPEAVGVGHKVARRNLDRGDQVVKYGAPIGSITEATPLGCVVHVHNMKSDYIASHNRKAAGVEIQ